MNLILSVVDMSVFKWWVNNSYAPHEKLRGHTGDTMYLEKGAVSILSTKMNINGKISTEEDMIGVGDATNKILCTKYFIEAQG